MSRMGRRSEKPADDEALDLLKLMGMPFAEAKVKETPKETPKPALNEPPNEPPKTTPQPVTV